MHHQATLFSADTGERYLSTPLFAGVDVDMNEDELKISSSTPNYRIPKAA